MTKRRKLAADAGNDYLEAVADGKIVLELLDRIDSAEGRLANALDGLGSAQSYIGGALRALKDGR